jgi:hypothetical protein
MKLNTYLHYSISMLKNTLFFFFGFFIFYHCLDSKDDLRIKNDEFIDSLSITYTLRKPDNTLIKIIKHKEQSLDTIFIEDFSKPGTYNLEIGYCLDKRIFDTLFYDFQINGEELYTDFYFKLSKEDDYYNSKEKEMHGYLNICKYYGNLEGVSLELIEKAALNKCPVFNILNNSKDTLYGKYLPGYFWGSISSLNKGKWSDPNFYTIDLNFRGKDPLFPNDSTYAYIGSFSECNLTTKGRYKFILHYSTSWFGLGVSFYKNTYHTSWWADTKEFHIIEYEFEVE